MAEWSKAAVLKTVISRDRNRGFESLSLLQDFSYNPLDIQNSLRALQIIVIAFHCFQSYSYFLHPKSTTFLHYHFHSPIQLVVKYPLKNILSALPTPMLS